MNTTLYFIRHGEVVNPLQLLYSQIRDIHLSPIGKKQIEAISKKMLAEKAKPTIIYSSPSIRTRETTKIIQSTFVDTPVVFRNELLETSAKHFAGRPLAWARALKNPYLQKYQDQYRYEIEKDTEVAQRMMSIVIEALAQHDGKCVFIVSHGDPITFAIDALRNHGVLTHPLDQLKSEGIYPLRGEVWKIVLSENYVIIDQEKISSDVKTL